MSQASVASSFWAMREWPLYGAGSVLGYRDLVLTASRASHGAEEEPKRLAPKSDWKEVCGGKQQGRSVHPQHIGQERFKGKRLVRWSLQGKHNWDQQKKQKTPSRGSSSWGKQIPGSNYCSDSSSVFSGRYSGDGAKIAWELGTRAEQGACRQEAHQETF